jgi:hypothetical protein
VAGRGWDQSRSQETDWKEDKCTLILLVITPTYFYLRVHFDDLHQQLAFTGNGGKPLVEMIGEKGTGVFVDHGPFQKAPRGKIAGALTTAATLGLGSPLGAEAQSSGSARRSYSTSVAENYRSFTCNYHSQSIHTGVAAFEYTPAPYRDFSESYKSHRHGLLYHIRNSWLAPQFPRFYATSLILFLAEFTGPLEGYEGVTAQCHNCGNWSAHCITRW